MPDVTRPLTLHVLVVLVVLAVLHANRRFLAPWQPSRGSHGHDVRTLQGAAPSRSPAA